MTVGVCNCITTEVQWLWVRLLLQSVILGGSIFTTEFSFWVVSLLTLYRTPPQKCVKLQYRPKGYNLPLVMVILGFLTIPWLGPKYAELCAPSVPKVKVGHADHVRHWC